MRTIKILILFIFYAFISKSQYYTSIQVDNINDNKLAFEGNLYLDTINKKYYIGLTNGKLKEIGISIDTIYTVEDTLFIEEGNKVNKTLLRSFGDNSFTVTQVGHGFTVPSYGVLPLTYNHNTNLYDLATLDTITNASDVLMVNSEDAGNSIRIQNTGYIELNHGLDVGYWWLLDDNVAGAIKRADTVHCDTGEIIQRLFFTASNNKILIQPEEPYYCYGNGINSSKLPEPEELETLPPCSGMVGDFGSNQWYWQFRLHNSSGGAISQWQIIIRNANYQINPANVSNNTQFVYSEVNNGDGTYDLIFTSTGGLGVNGYTPYYQLTGSVNFGYTPTSSGVDYYCIR